MSDPQLIAQLAEKITQQLDALNLGETLPSARLKALVQEALGKLDLVSREDYERLLAIHQQTRQRVDELSRRLTQLESLQNAGNEPH